MKALLEKHWIDADLLAPNVREIAFDPLLLAPLAAAVDEVRALASDACSLRLLNGMTLAVERPPAWNSDIVWLSQGDEETYRRFEAVFDALRLRHMMAPHVDHDRALVLYSGFFVMRRTCSSPHFHRDWLDANNDAYTFITPLTANAGDLGLLYRDMRGETREYAYQKGRGLVFGDYFHHATAAGEAARPVVLLSMTFGTDRMDRWERVGRTAVHQGPFFRQPDGTFVDRRMG